MNKNVVIPIVVFFLSTLLTLMFHPVALLVAGVTICVIATLRFRVRKVIEPKLSSKLLFRSGFAVIAGAISAVVFVLTTMSGLFNK
jgi:hypothetical protein